MKLIVFVLFTPYLFPCARRPHSLLKLLVNVSWLGLLMRLSIVSLVSIGRKMWWTLCWDTWCVVKWCVANCLNFVPCLPVVRRRLCFPRVVCDQRWYLCGRGFAKRAFFSSLLCIFSSYMGMDAISGMVGGPIIGDDVGWEAWVGSAGGCTLGDGVTCAGCCWWMVSVRFNCSARFMSTLRTGSGF